MSTTKSIFEPALPLNADQQKILKSLEGMDGHTAIAHITHALPAWIERPAKPASLKPNHSANDAVDYAKALAKYETALASYTSRDAERRHQHQFLIEVLEEYLMQLSGARKLPASTAAKVWSQAWSDGHSSGYTEVYGCLINLVELFDDIDFTAIPVQYLTKS